jgi:hypothetical protein
MQLLAAATATLALAGAALAAPAPAPATKTVHLTFHGAPVEYYMAVPADGRIHKTYSTLNINIIDAPEYASSRCTFYTYGDKALVVDVDYHGTENISVGPPQPIVGVKCSYY